MTTIAHTRQVFCPDINSPSCASIAINLPTYPTMVSSHKPRGQHNFFPSHNQHTEFFFGTTITRFEEKTTMRTALGMHGKRAVPRLAPISALAVLALCTKQSNKSDFFFPVVFEVKFTHTFFFVARFFFC